MRCYEITPLGTTAEVLEKVKALLKQLGDHTDNKGDIVIELRRSRVSAESSTLGSWQVAFFREAPSLPQDAIQYMAGFWG
jgi:hypothetical protein